MDPSFPIGSSAGPRPDLEAAFDDFRAPRTAALLTSRPSPFQHADARTTPSAAATTATTTQHRAGGRRERLAQAEQPSADPGPSKASLPTTAPPTTTKASAAVAPSPTDLAAKASTTAPPQDPPPKRKRGRPRKRPLTPPPPPDGDVAPPKSKSPKAPAPTAAAAAANAAAIAPGKRPKKRGHGWTALRVRKPPAYRSPRSAVGSDTSSQPPQYPSPGSSSSPPHSTHRKRLLPLIRPRLIPSLPSYPQTHLLAFRPHALDDLYRRAWAARGGGGGGGVDGGEPTGARGWAGDVSPVGSCRRLDMHRLWLHYARRQRRAKETGGDDGDGDGDAGGGSKSFTAGFDIGGGGGGEAASDTASSIDTWRRPKLFLRRTMR